MCVLCINYFLAFVYKLLKTDDTVALTLVWHFHLSLPSPRDSPTFLYGQRWGQVVRTSYTEAKFAKQAFPLSHFSPFPLSSYLPLISPAPCRFKVKFCWSELFLVSCCWGYLLGLYIKFSRSHSISVLPISPALRVGLIFFSTLGSCENRK